MNVYDVLRRPIVTEKTTLLGEQGQYVFEVSRDANKTMVKDAVEKRFGVTVLSVNVMRMPGKSRRFGRFVTKTPWWKKAVVTLAPGQSIEVHQQ